MGVVATSYISKASNTTSGFSGQGTLRKGVVTPPPTVENLKQKAVGQFTTKALSRTASRLNPYIFAVSTAYDLAMALKDYVAGDDEIVDQTVQNYYEQVKYNDEQSKELEDKLSSQLEALEPPEAGETLPSVLTTNSKALVEGINTFTTTFGEKFDSLNNFMFGLLSYMDVLTGYLENSYNLNKESSDEAKKTIKIDNEELTPKQIETLRNISMMRAYEFRTTPVDQSILEANSVQGMTPLEIEASHRSFEVEAKVFAMTPTQVKDWDENVLADIAPREARLVKDATVAKETTDKNNFDIDDLIDDNPLDLTSILGYEKSSDIILDYVQKMQGKI